MGRSLRKRAQKSYKFTEDSDLTDTEADNKNVEETDFAIILAPTKIPARKPRAKKSRADAESDESDVYQEVGHESSSSEEELPVDPNEIAKELEGSDIGSDHTHSDAESAVSVHAVNDIEPEPEVSPELVKNRNDFQESLNQLVEKCFQSMLTRVKYMPVKSSRKGAPKKQEPVKPLEEIEIDCIKAALVDDEGRFACPVPGCDKVFKTVPSIKYHANTFRHFLPAFLANVKKELDQTEQLSDIQTELLQQLNDFKVPGNLDAEFDVSSPHTSVFVMEKGAPNVSKLAFLFELNFLDSSKEIESLNELGISHVVPEMNEHQKLLYDIVNDSIICLLVSVPEKPVTGRNAGKCKEFFKDGQQQVLTFPAVETEEGERWQCCIPGCSKLFKTQPSIKYHFEKCNHDLETFLKHCFIDEMSEANQFAELRQKYQQIKDVASLKDVIEKGLENHLMASKEFLYHWPKLDGAYCSAINFANEIPDAPDSKPTLKKDLSQKYLKNMFINGPPGYNFSRAPSQPATQTSLQQLLLDKEKVQIVLSEQEQALYVDVSHKVKVEHRGKPNLPTYDISSTEVKEITDISGRPGFLIYTGGSVNSCEWSDYVDQDQCQYVAVGTGKDSAPLVWNQRHEGKGTIQIWSMKCSDRPEYSAPELKLVICHDNGSVLDLKWCPSGGIVPSTDNAKYSRLGLIAATFSNGMFCIYAIPDPNEIQDPNHAMPYFIRLEPLFSTHYEEGGVFTKLSWSRGNNHSLIATGCSSGSVIIWSVKDLQTKKTMRPCTIIKIHDFNVCALEWHDQDQFVLLSTGSDGKTCFTDVREHIGGGMQISRMFEFPFTVTSTKQSIFACNSDFVMKETLPEEDLYRGVNVTIGSNAALSASSSNYHEFLATASTCGEVKITNINLCKIRSQKGVLVHLFNLKPAETEDSYVFGEHVKHETLVSQKSSKNRMLFESTNCALTRVLWNPIETASTWIITSSKCGFLRIECTKSKK